MKKLSPAMADMQGTSTWKKIVELVLKNISWAPKEQTNRLYFVDRNKN